MRSLASNAPAAKAAMAPVTTTQRPRKRSIQYAARLMAAKMASGAISGSWWAVK